MKSNMVINHAINYERAVKVSNHNHDVWFCLYWSAAAEKPEMPIMGTGLLQQSLYIMSYMCDAFKPPICIITCDDHNSPFTSLRCYEATSIKRVITSTRPLTVRYLYSRRNVEGVLGSIAQCISYLVIIKGHSVISRMAYACSLFYWCS